MFAPSRDSESIHYTDKIDEFGLVRSALPANRTGDRLIEAEGTACSCHTATASCEYHIV